jgi:hypothetical protein
MSRTQTTLLSFPLSLSYCVSTNTLYPFLHLIFPFTQSSHSFRTSQKTIQTVYILLMYLHISSRNPLLISHSKHDLRQKERDRQLCLSPSYSFIILTTCCNQAQSTELNQFLFELTISLTYFGAHCKGIALEQPLHQEVIIQNPSHSIF